MFKSKLQELCRQKSWPLPKYAAIKDGPDHKPLFKASVFINGEFFESPTFYGSSKQAHDKAARAAFTHFTSLTGSVIASSEAKDDGSVIANSEAKDDGLKTKLTGKSSEISQPTAEDETGKKPKGGLHEQYHIWVPVKGGIFERSKPFDAVGEAESTDVARIAMSSLSLQVLPKDSGNSSQKLAESEDHKTKKNGKKSAANADAGSASVKGNVFLTCHTLVS